MPLVPALVLAVVGFGRMARTRGALPALGYALIGTIGGLLTGLALGVGARVAMRLLAVALSQPLRLTADGTILVIAAFACVGAVLGFIYAGTLRELLRRRGLVYGLLLAAVTLQPFLRTAAEDLHRSQRSPEVLLGTIGMSFSPERASRAGALPLSKVKLHRPGFVARQTARSAWYSSAPRRGRVMPTEVLPCSQRSASGAVLACGNSGMRLFLSCELRSLVYFVSSPPTRGMRWA